MRPVLLLDERIRGDGRHVKTWASAVGDRVRIADDDGVPDATMSVAALERVMCHFGKPLDDTIPLDGPALVLGDRTLRRLRFHVQLDAEARDYLVWERPDHEPLVVLATTVTAALRYLALGLSQKTET
jgi:hypothetical protein